MRTRRRTYWEYVTVALTKEHTQYETKIRWSAFLERLFWSADLSGRQSRTDANLKAHLLEIRSCRAPKSKRYVTEVRPTKELCAW